MTFAFRLFSSALAPLRCPGTVVAFLAAMLFPTLVSAGMTGAMAGTTQKWKPGWDLFSEPLNFTKSNITWSVDSATKTFMVTFNLVGATPTKLYQVGVHIFCTTFPATFGQFPNPGGSTCQSLTRQGVTRTLTAIEFGVVLTDRNGNGSFTVAVGPIAAGTYHLEFDARNGAGCNVTGGAGNNFCALDFQSPGPFGIAPTKITIP